VGWRVVRGRDYRRLIAFLGVVADLVIVLITKGELRRAALGHDGRRGVVERHLRIAIEQHLTRLIRRGHDRRLGGDWRRGCIGRRTDERHVVRDIRLSLGVELFDSRGSGRALFVACMLSTPREVRLEVVRSDEVLDVEERRALLPDVDERCLQARKHARHTTEHDAADAAAAPVLTFSFDVKLGDDAVFDERYANFTDVDADDQYVLRHANTELSRQRACAPRMNGSRERHR